MSQENRHPEDGGSEGGESSAAAYVEDRINLTPIWLLPLVVLIAVSWLLWRELDHGGIEVMIRFENGRGIAVDKTEVLHNGIPVGHVTRLSPSKDFDAVDVTVKMDQRFQTLLTENSAFWLVEPQLSLTEVSGLDTLITGNYIAFSPSSEGTLQAQFTALKRAPGMMGGKDGLRLILQSDELPSLEIGSPVFYRKLKVGEVFDYGLSEDGLFVETQIYIQSEFSKLVHENTRFWSAGGLKVSANMTNLEVQAQSLVSILKGGVAFYTPEWEEVKPVVSSGAEFSLYSDYDTAEAGIPITIEFPLGVSLGDSNIPIRFHGQEVGRIRSVDVSEDVSRVIAEAIVRPEVKPALVAGTRFWVVEPKLGLDGVSDLDTLISGRYVAMDINKRVMQAGSAVSHFKGMETRPATPIGAIGLSLTLETDALKGIDIGSPVLYRNVPVGFVQSYDLKGRGLSIQVLIEARYQHLVNMSSRFWNVSGLQFEGDLRTFRVDMASIKSLISGGVAFSTGKPDAERVENGARFPLFSDQTVALSGDQEIEIHFDRADGLSEGTQIRFRGVEVGRVTRLLVSRENQGVTVKALIDNDKSWLMRKGVHFWLVEPKLGLARTSNLETLIIGPYIQVEMPAIPGPETTQFIGQHREPDDIPKAKGLALELVSESLGSIQRGSPVYYRDVPVGEVTGYRLANPADQVVIIINIEDRYRRLISSDSRFWNVSGIDIDVGLFRGASIRADSLEALLAGGIAFATPEKPEAPIQSGHRFDLAGEPKKSWLLWQPEIWLH